MRRAIHSGPEISAATKLAYGIGALGDSIKTFSFTTFLLFFYTTVLGLPGSLLGVAMAVGLVWDASIDPMIGQWSDHARPAFGRRHSFMLAGALGAGAAFVAVFDPPSGLSTPWLFAWLVVSSLCVRSSNSLFMVPYYALGAEMTSDYHERTSISGYRAGAVLAGTLLATAAAFRVFLTTDAPSGAGSRYVTASYASMGLAFGITIAVVGLIATFGTLAERPRLASATAGEGRPGPSRRAIFSTLRDPSFRVLLGSSSLALMATAINAALSLHYLTYHARIVASDGLWIYYAGFYAGSLAGVLVWVRVSRSFEKHHVFTAATLVAAAVVSCGYWLVGPGRPFGTGNVAVMTCLSGLAGFFGIAGAVVAPSMMADITAADEHSSGERRDGAFFGVYSFGQQLSSGIAILIASILIDRYAGLAAGQPTQSAVTVERVAMIACVLPALILTVAGLIASRYRLTRQAVHALQTASEAPPVPGSQVPV